MSEGPVCRRLSLVCCSALAGLALWLAPGVAFGQGPAKGARTPAQKRLEEAHRQYEAAADLVHKCVLKEKVELERTRVDLEQLQGEEAERLREAAREQGDLAALQWQILEDTDEFETAGTLDECHLLRRQILTEQKRLLANKGQLAVAVDRLAAQRQLVQSAGAALAADDMPLKGLAPVEEWPEERRREFEAARQERTDVLAEQLAVIERLKAVQQGRLEAVQESLAFLEERLGLVVATKDRLFWEPEPIPYSAHTVAGAVRDLAWLAAQIPGLALALPSVVGRTVRQLGSSAGLLWQLALAAVALAGSLFVFVLVGRRARAWLDGVIARRQEQPVTAGNRLGLMLLRVAASEVRCWLASAPLAGAWLLFVTLQRAYLLGGPQAAAGEPEPAAGVDPYRLALALFCAYAVIACYRILSGCVREAISVGRGRERLLRLPLALGPRVQRGVRLLLAAGVLMLVPICVLTSLGYDRAFVGLLWTVLRGLMFLIILWMVARRGMVEKIFRERKTLTARVLRRLLTFLYPAVIGAVLFLLVFRSVGFVALSRSVVIVTIEVALGLSAIWIGFWALNRWIKRRQGQLFDAAKEHRRLYGAAQAVKLARFLVNVLWAIVAVYFVVKLLSYHYATAVFSPYAPAFVRVPSERCAAFAKGVLGWFTEPIYGETMSPLSLLLGVLIVLVVILLSGSLRRAVNRRILARAGLEESARHTLSAVIAYAVIAIAGIVALNVSGLPLAGLGIFAGASGLAVGFGMQAILSNFVSGLIIMIERHVKVGDCVKVGEDLIGYVERINARSTTIATFDNYRVIIPNSAFIEQQVVNWSTQDPKLRVRVDVGIAYGSDTEQARQSLLQVASGNEFVLKQPAPEVRFTGFGDNSLAFQLLVWVADVRHYYAVISSLHFEIDREFREKRIEIAFPQQDLHLRTVDGKAAEALLGHPRGTLPGESGADKG